MRVITHWTAGAYEVSELDLEHYHLLIDGEGRLHRGRYTVADNEDTSDGTYAAHTYRCNTRSIGVAVACMAGASLGSAGRYPMRATQWDTMAAVVAEVLRRYRIPLRPDTVLGHGEVARTLGIDQGGKWDPLYLPWRPSAGLQLVGNLFRAEVGNRLGFGPTTPAPPRPADPRDLRPCTVVYDGHRLAGWLTNEGCWVELRLLATMLGWEVVRAMRGKADVELPGGSRYTLPLLIHAGTGYSPVREVAEVAGLDLRWDHAAKVATLGRRS